MTARARRSDTIVVLEQDEPIAFSFDDMLRYHGGGSPGGVAHAFKVMERALPLLEPDGATERRQVTIHTAFGGPGARDAFELVTRAVTDERYVIDPAMARAERGRALERFVFRLAHRGTAVTLGAREGFVTEEFIDLARKESRTANEEEHLTVLKLEMAGLVMSSAPGDVYEVVAD